MVRLNLGFVGWRSILKQIFENLARTFGVVYRRMDCTSCKVPLPPTVVLDEHL
jgi:hypothetical protein